MTLHCQVIPKYIGFTSSHLGHSQRSLANRVVDIARNITDDRFRVRCHERLFSKSWRLIPVESFNFRNCINCIETYGFEIMLPISIRGSSWNLMKICLPKVSIMKICLNWSAFVIILNILKSFVIGQGPMKSNIFILTILYYLLCLSNWRVHHPHYGLDPCIMHQNGCKKAFNHTVKFLAVLAVSIE